MIGPLDQFISSYHKSLTSEPKNAPIFNQIAEFYYSKGNLEEALDACQQALQIQPDSKKASLNLEKIFKALRNINPDSPTNDLTINNWLEIDAESIADYPDAINQISRGNINGMLIKNVYSKAEIEQARQNITCQQDKLYNMSTNFGKLLGLIVIKSGNNKTKYFQESLIFQKELRNIFATDFEKKIAALLTKMSGGRVVKQLEEDNSQKYLPASVRIVKCNSGGIEAHAENQSYEIFHSSTDYLRKVARLTDSLNYFIVIEKAERGGELIIYDQLWEPKSQIQTEELLLLSPHEKEALFKKANMMYFNPGVNRRYFNPDIGDMILFRGSNIWHQVADVKGNTDRMTIGAFISISKDGKEIFYWH